MTPGAVLLVRLREFRQRKFAKVIENRGRLIELARNAQAQSNSLIESVVEALGVVRNAVFDRDWV